MELDFSNHSHPLCPIDSITEIQAKIFVVWFGVFTVHQDFCLACEPQLLLHQPPSHSSVHSALMWEMHKLCDIDRHGAQACRTVMQG